METSPINSIEQTLTPTSKLQLSDRTRENEKTEIEKFSSIIKVQPSETVLDFQHKRTIEKLKQDNSIIGAQPKPLNVTPVKNQFQEYENIYKIILIGSSFTGKTSLLIRFVSDMFDPNYLNTVGVDLKSQTLKIHDTMARINIWDTTGQEKFRSLTKSYYRNCQGAVAVFDLTKKESLYSVEAQIREFKYNSPEEAKDNIVLVGNKSDLANQRQVTEADAQELCQKLGLLEYFETSAQTNVNVDKAFFKVAMRAYEIDKLQSQNDQQINPSSVSLKQQFKQNGRTSTSLQLQDYSQPQRKKKEKCCS